MRTDTKRVSGWPLTQVLRPLPNAGRRGVRLASARLVLAEGGRAELGQRVRLNVSEDDVAFALRNDDIMRRILM